MERLIFWFCVLVIESSGTALSLCLLVADAYLMSHLTLNLLQIVPTGFYFLK